MMLICLRLIPAIIVIAFAILLLLLSYVGC